MNRRSLEERADDHDGGRDGDSQQAGRSGDRIPLGARFSAPFQTGRKAHPAFCTVGTGFLSRGQSDRGVVLTTHPLLVPRLRMGWSFILHFPLYLHWHVMGWPLSLLLLLSVICREELSEVVKFIRRATCCSAAKYSHCYVWRTLLYKLLSS